MQNKLDNLKKSFLEDLEKLQNRDEILDLQNKFLGKKGELKAILAGLKDLSIEDKKSIWQSSNILKNFIADKLEEKTIFLDKKAFDEVWDKEAIDVTLDFPSTEKGHMHPISITSKLIEEIFISLGFKVEDGPQIETEEFNFDKLNIPDNHPARDVWDTFWIDDEINKDKKSWDKYLLRTHTSPVQVRTMLKWELPIKIIVPGRVFRYEQEDARHTCNFYQLEWLVVWEKINFWNLKWTLETVMQKLLWDQTKLRFRPSIFPFTEPSAEIDVSCQLCKWTGKVKNSNCRMCSATGWVELLWAGMVHPTVLEWAGIDPEKYSGFAFGMWIDRIASQRFWVSSSRMFYQSKLKLNEQF